MACANVTRPGHSATPFPLAPGGFPSRLIQIRAYQQLARVRLAERLAGNPTGATLYDLLMRDQLAFIRLATPATHA